MSRGGYGDSSYRGNAGKLRMAVTTELLRVIRDMRHADELFQWLSDTLVQHFDTQVVQFWVAQVDHQGQYFMKLQVLSSQDNSIPYRVALSKPFADLAGEIRSWQTELPLSLTGNVFSSFQASLLQRYGLYYCSAEYLSSKGQPPSVGRTTFMPLEAVALLFFNQSPHVEIPKSINYVLKLALQLAESGGLLVPPTDAQSNEVGYKHQVAQKGVSPLAEVVPRRTENTDLMTANNPLARHAIIADKLARRVYKEIDGRNTVQELCDITQLSMTEVRKALRILLNEHRIELFDAIGQPEDGSSLLDDL
ncbi:MAG TPA: hypothetical protein VFQ36_24910 [Ktedonobacteraceae bacterium]|nr:hypothetical protein [Ktedonobacteraceae bacterium]